jgi:hypothetical protein
MIRYGTKIDLGHEETEKIITGLEKKLRAAYKKASEDVERSSQNSLKRSRRRTQGSATS